MRLLVLSLSCVAFIAMSIGVAQERYDLERLQGKWTVVSVNLAGKKLPMKGESQLTLTFKGNTYVSKKEGKVAKSGTFVLDPKKTPKQIDIITAKGTNTELIYKFEGDKFVLCSYTQSKSKRPTSFEGDKDNPVLVLTLEQKK